MKQSKFNLLFNIIAQCLNYDFIFRASAVNECRRLLSKALKGPLNLTQLDQLSAVVKKVDSAIVAAGVTPAQYPDLVEFNPVIAYDVLICLMSTNQITDYFSVLVNMDMSLHSMEVVNRLTTTVELPTEFVHLYISNCITLHCWHAATATQPLDD